MAACPPSPAFMVKRLPLRLLVFSLLWLALLLANGPARVVAAPVADLANGVDGAAVAENRLDVYVREGCPHCQAVEAFLPRLRLEHPWLRVEIHRVDQDPEARDALVRLSEESGVWPPGVPSFVFAGRLLVGFQSPEASGSALRQLLRQETHTEQVGAGVLSVERMGLALFTLALGLLDGFNPCAMWVLLVLLSLLIHVRDRLRMGLIAGTFVLVSGAVYFAFMATWLNVFLAVGLSPLVRLALAAIAIVIGLININDVRRRAESFTLSIPDSAKRMLYHRMRGIITTHSLSVALVSAAMLAVLVNIVELLCTAGLPAVYTAILTQQGLETAAYYGYLGLYILGYIADDALMVGLAVAALGSLKLTPESGRWLKLISGLVMLALGLVMVLRPQWLVLG